MYILSHDNFNFDKIKVTFAGITKSERRENVASSMDDGRNEGEANEREARHDKDGGDKAEQEGDREDHPADEEENGGDLVVEDLEDG